jgi:hypothetical protein
MNEVFNLSLNTDGWDFVHSKMSDEDQKAFHEFGDARVSHKMLKSTLMSALVTLIYFTTMALIHGSSKFVLYVTPCLIFTFFLRIPCILFLLWHCEKLKDKKYKISSKVTICVPYCRIFSSFASQITLSLFLLARILNGRCHSLDQLHMWSCNSEIDSRALPQEFMVILMMYPIANSIIFKNLPIIHVYVSWLASLVVIALFIGIAGATQSIPALLLYLPFSGAFLMENYRQDLILFHVVKSQKKLLLENKQMSDEMATELRHMIANVAHDLKTVPFLPLFPFLC